MHGLIFEAAYKSWGEGGRGGFGVLRYFSTAKQVSYQMLLDFCFHFSAWYGKYKKYVLHLVFFMQLSNQIFGRTFPPKSKQLHCTKNADLVTFTEEIYFLCSVIDSFL